MFWSCGSRPESQVLRERQNLTTEVGHPDCEIVTVRSRLERSSAQLIRGEYHYYKILLPLLYHSLR